MKNFLYELKLSYHRTGEKEKYGSIKSSLDAFRVLEGVFDRDLIEAREEFVILYLNRTNTVIGFYKAFQGGVASVVADTKLILTMGLKTLASGIILAHNHPSGRLNPSEQDIRLTRRVREACRHVEIELLDHLIVTADNGYFSFADEGKL
ncbi:JAB domain-containing protein [Algoriphagus hitonicola]|nr:JAB domain-containing protein [Algoriphagus hitonicola]